MNGWQTLHEELDAWRDGGRVATFWWRDDDAADRAPALDRLLDLAARHDAPLNLAVIPALATDALTVRLARAAAPLTVLQHGFAHVNHAPAGEKRMELGLHRPGVAICEELSRGLAMLEATFGTRLAPVLVPPWNRIAEDLVSELAGLGFRGLSRHTPRQSLRPAPGLIACNTHLDVLRWRPERAFLGEDEALDLLIGHLRARRRKGVGPATEVSGSTEPDEPTGLLTHHLAMDEAAWAFVARLLDALAACSSVRWVSADEAFQLTAAAGTKR